MPIESATLDAIARAYTSPMTVTRGRRIHRLLMREFSRYDHVLPATAEDGAPVLIALLDGGGIAVCRSDGRGPAAEVVEWGRLEGAALTISRDLLKDSLPIVGWTISHPGFARIGRSLSISAALHPPKDHPTITELLRAQSRSVSLFTHR